MFSPLVSIAYAADGETVGMPQLNPDYFPSQIIWLIAAIVVLHFLLSKIALPRVSEIITTREQAIIGDVERAEELHKTAGELRARIAEQHAATLAEAQRIAAEARAAAVREIEAEQSKAVERLTEGTREGEKRVQALRDALARAPAVGTSEDTLWDEPRREAAAHIERIAWDVAAALVEKIQGRSADTGAVMESVRNRTRAG